MYIQLIIIKVLFNYVFSSNCTFTEIQNKLRYFDGSELRIVSDNLVNLNVDTETVRFLIIGDWGGLSSYPYKTTLQKSVSRQMTQSANRIKSQFQISLGNNFLESGVKSIDDFRFQRTFENVYESESLQTPWFITLGKHDYLGDISAQLKYTYRSKRWIQPSTNYSVDIKSLKTSKILLKIIMIDTIALCMTDNPLYKNQLETILQENKKLNISFLIAVGNQPIWTINTLSNKNCLNEKLKPLLHFYNVKAYFSGTDQLFQHITDMYLESKVEYFTAGNGAYAKQETEINDYNLGNVAKLKYRAFQAGFIRIQANNTHMIVGFVDSKGINIYNYAITNSIRL